MIEGFQHELIVLPAAARLQIPPCLRSAGIEVAPSQKSTPAKIKDAGIMFACTENKGRAEILIMDDTWMKSEHRSMVAVLIVPGRGALGDWFCGTTDRILRKKIHDVLYALKSELATQQARSR